MTRQTATPLKILQPVLTTMLYIVLAAVATASCGKASSGKNHSSGARNNVSDNIPPNPSASVAGKKMTDETPRVSIATSSLFRNLKQTPVNYPVSISPLKNGNVVLLISDALNAGHLSAYGYHRETSPYMASFAKTGLTLTNHVSNSSWTRPSFTTIVTGVPKSVHHVEAAGGWRLAPEIVTLAERFQKAGYQTAGFTGNPLVRKSWGFDQGFQKYEGPTTRGLKAFPRDSIWVDAAMKWLDEIQKDKPFFLMLFLTSAHPPYRPPMEPRTFLSQVPPGEIIEHPFREYKTPLSTEDDQRIEAAYDDEIAYMDSQIKRLMAHLQEQGRWQKTVVTLTADHGEMMGEHDCYLHAYHMWEQNTRVPFMIAAPNLPLENAMDDRPYTHIDIAPTLLDMVGIAYDDTVLTGRSLVKTLSNPDKFKTRYRYTQVDAHGVRRQTIRHGDWKLVHHDQVPDYTEKHLDDLHTHVKMPNPRDLPSLAWDGERWELFNLAKDPFENQNRYEDNKSDGTVTELKDAMLKLRSRKTSGNQNAAKMAPELLEALKNAGYIR